MSRRLLFLAFAVFLASCGSTTVSSEKTLKTFKEEAAGVKGKEKKYRMGYIPTPPSYVEGKKTCSSIYVEVGKRRLKLCNITRAAVEFTVVSDCSKKKVAGSLKPLSCEEIAVEELVGRGNRCIFTVEARNRKNGCLQKINVVWEGMR